MMDFNEIKKSEDGERIMFPVDVMGVMLLQSRVPNEKEKLFIPDNGYEALTANGMAKILVVNDPDETHDRVFLVQVPSHITPMFVVKTDGIRAALWRLVGMQDSETAIYEVQKPSESQRYKPGVRRADEN